MKVEKQQRYKNFCVFWGRDGGGPREEASTSTRPGSPHLPEIRASRGPAKHTKAELGAKTRH